ncbi:helix-turn-helix domain-containing protein [Streptomyces fagopyri]|uniref:Helix-turn-helix domain-containing protein n=2 Tax=Streptomyces fagopyri TaxID=2662397 RepID=A0A5Q0L8J9_9ACTN|nr:helix-turn-helix domain-containing protein [Streptomyces fagopyri]
MLRLHMAKLLVKAREFGDESVIDVAQRTGISRSTLHRLAAGTKQPSLATLWTLRDAYGVRLDTLVYDDPRTMRSTPVRLARAATAHLEATTIHPLHDPGADH